MPRKTLKQRADRDAAKAREQDSFGFNAAADAEDNRVRQFLSELNNETNDPEEMMLEIMGALNDTVTPIPEVGGFYTFVYNAKTPGKPYDQHPLIACTSLERWGFKGLNFHWRKSRNYTWNELAGQLYIVQRNELDDLLNIPYAKFIFNPR
jgi:hypothetical protein|tara:strand:+ start:2575 stop:3027 length:453 start_codon:yes stop_codon:yes gene_type:complete